MANHVEIVTKKHMTPKKINELLKRLNDELFFGVVKFEQVNEGYYKKDGGPTWYISFEGVERTGSVFWLNTRQKFELNFCVVPNFPFWVSECIIWHIQQEFEGRVLHEEGNGYCPPDNFADYQLRRFKDEEIGWRMFMFLFKHEYKYCVPKHYRKQARIARKKVQLKNECP